MTTSETDPIERLAAAIEHTAWMQAATQTAGLGWVPRGCSREDFAVARAELRDAIRGAISAPSESSESKG